MLRHRLSLLIVLLNISLASAQTATKIIHSREQLWFGYFNQTRFTDKLGMWVDVHYRQTDNFT